MNLFSSIFQNIKKYARDPGLDKAVPEDEGILFVINFGGYASNTGFDYIVKGPSFCPYFSWCILTASKKKKEEGRNQITLNQRLGQLWETQLLAADSSGIFKYTSSFHSSPSWCLCSTHNNPWGTISVLMKIFFLPYKDIQICWGMLERMSMYWNQKKRAMGLEGSGWCKFSLCFYNTLRCFMLLRGERKHTKARHDSIITHGSSSAPSALEHAINSPIHKQTHTVPLVAWAHTN